MFCDRGRQRFSKVGTVCSKYTRATHLFEIDLGVETGISDEVDDPPFSLFASHPESVRKFTARG